MSTTIYRKYRPQSFEELTGQNHIKITLQNQLKTGKVAHAYLFTGPRGVGKTTTARLLAAAVNCPDGKNCEEIYLGRDLDVIEIDAASHSGVDNVRENIIENSRFTPQRRKFKVFIIDEVHMLSISAFNALLKLLEEPPKHVIFILATTELHKVPETIVSRCQRFDFKKIPTDQIIERLASLAAQEKVKVEREVLSDIARMSDGSLRDAESVLGQVLALGEKNITRDQASLILPQVNLNSVIDLLNSLRAKNAEQGITLVNELVEKGVDLNQFTHDTLEVLRKIMINQVSGSLNNLSFGLSQEIEGSVLELSKKFSQVEVLKMIDLFAKKRLEIKTSILPQLPLELVVVEVCGSSAHATASSVPIQPTAKAVGGMSVGDKVRAAMPKSVVQQPAVSKKEKSTPEAKPKKSSTKNLKITIEEVKNKWPSFLTHLQSINPSLVLILKTAEPLKIEGTELEIGYKYPFHKARMDSAEILNLLGTQFEKFYKESAAITNTILPADYKSEFIEQVTNDDEVELVAEKEASTSDDLIANLVQAFGSKVTE